ncbi:MAG: hypothetical protein KatS3mg098_186 [Candidatus Parcubacteria bacterium]|nr:MAG: hypothetical protein KatS3mg098_186 [Candidatus Parcubacteria bacterium]
MKKISNFKIKIFIFFIFSLFSLLFHSKLALATCNPVTGEGEGLASAEITSLNFNINYQDKIVYFSGFARPGLNCSNDTFYLGVDFQVDNTNIGGTLIEYYSSHSGNLMPFTGDFYINNLFSGTYTLRVIAYGPPGAPNDEETRTFSISPPTCSPSYQTVEVGQMVSFSASDGMLTGDYNWTASGGNPSSGSGTSFSTSYSSTGTKTVTVKKGNDPTAGTCTVNVISDQGGGGNTPTASLTSNYDSILKGNPVTLSWTSSNADRCDALAGAGFSTNGSTSGSDEVNPLSGDTTFSIRCYKDTNGNNQFDNGEPSAQANKTVTIFYHTLNIDAALYSNSNCTGSTIAMGQDANSVTVTVKKSSTGQIFDFGVGPQNIWGTMPETYSVSNATINNTSYKYCGSSSSVTFNSVSQTQTETLTAFFAPISGQDNPPSSPPSNLSAFGECHQNYPSASTQVYLSWSAVSGATSYNVYRNGSYIGSTTNTDFIDRNLSFNQTYSYQVSAVNNKGEGPKSNSVSATTPSSCSNPPGGGGGGGNNPTYVITPSEASIEVGNEYQFTGLYDPDGTNDRYGDFDVTSLANWGIKSGINYIQKTGPGKYKGLSPGSDPQNITSSYNSISASATLNVVSSSSYFTLSISPSYQEVTKPGLVTYTVTVSSQNGFNGTVSLSVLGLPSGITASLNPSSVTLSNNSQNSTLTLNISSNASIGRSTFSVKGSNQNLSYTDSADINILGNSTGPLSCSLNASPNPANAGNSVTLSTTISGGSGSYRCRFYYEPGSVDLDYFNCSDRTHTYFSSGTYTPSVDVIDQNNSQLQTSCNTSLIVFPGNENSYHTECINNACVIVDGPGNNQCLSNNDCNQGNNNPFVDLKVNNSDGPLTIGYPSGSPLGGLMNISWNSNNVSLCQASAQPAVNGWSGSLPNSGSTDAFAFDTNPNSSGTQYRLSLSCSPNKSDFVDVNIIECGLDSSNDPACQQFDSCYLNATPDTVFSGQFSTLTWGCSFPEGKTCFINQEIGQVNASGGSLKVNPRKTTTYTLSCTGVPDVSTTVSVSFLKKLKEVIPW